MSGSLAYQVVVSGGVVVATHDINEDIYDVYDHGPHDWFVYALPLEREEIVSIDEEFTIDGPDGPEIVVRTRSTTRIKESVPDPRITMSLANAKLAVISMLTSNTKHEILATYPIQKQIDINRLANPYIAQDKTDMETFIDGKYTTLGSKTSAVNALTTVNDIIAYNVWA